MKILKEYAEEKLVIVVTHDRSILSDVDMLIEMWGWEIEQCDYDREQRGIR